MAQDAKTATSTNTESLQDRINREYRAMKRADKAAFQRALQDAGLPPAVGDSKVSARAVLIAELLKLKG